MAEVSIRILMILQLTPNTHYKYQILTHTNMQNISTLPIKWQHNELVSDDIKTLSNWTTNNFKHVRIKDTLIMIHSEIGRAHV